MRQRGRLYPGDCDHIVRLTPGIWEKLSKEAVERGMSRASLARLLIDFVLNNPAAIDEVCREELAAE